MAAVAFFVGLVVGSFLNVVISRYGNDQLVRGRSRCPDCKKELAWYDLIPLVSFFALDRKCRHCDKKISWQYPLVEFLTAAGFAVIFVFSQNITFALWLAVLWVLSVLVFLYDLKHQTIPDSFTVLMLAWVLVGSILFSRDTMVIQALSGLALFGFFMLLYAVSAGRWIGGGDVKLSFVLGFWVGWPGAIVALFFAYVVGALVVLPFLFMRKTTLASRVPFGPFLLTAAWVAFLWGDQIASWYQRIIL